MESRVALRNEAAELALKRLQIALAKPSTDYLGLPVRVVGREIADREKTLRPNRMFCK